MRSKSAELMEKMIEYIDEVYSQSGRTPSYREIASKFAITNACVSNYINEMANKNMLSIRSGSRGIITKKMQKTTNDITNVAVVGSISCGTPLLAEENIERYIQIPTDLLGMGKYFILRASGDSMINVGINDGDLVIIKQQETAEQGQIIVALIDHEATLKRYYLDSRKKLIRLHPENDNMEDMYFDHIAIQGVAVKVIKDLN